MFKYIIVCSLVFGLINCQYGGTPQLRKAQRPVFREQVVTTTTTTEEPLPLDNYDDNSQFDTSSFDNGYQQPQPQPVPQPVPVSLPLPKPVAQPVPQPVQSGYGSQQTISRVKPQGVKVTKDFPKMEQRPAPSYSQQMVEDNQDSDDSMIDNSNKVVPPQPQIPLTRMQPIRTEPVQSTYGGSQPTISRMQPVKPESSQPTYGGSQQTISRMQPVKPESSQPIISRMQPVSGESSQPTYGGSQPTISRSKTVTVPKPTPQRVMPKPVQTPVRDRPVGRPTQINRDQQTTGGAYGNTLVISKPQRDQLVLPSEQQQGLVSQFGIGQEHKPRPKPTVISSDFSGSSDLQIGCKSNPCLNEATCIDNGNSYSCQCPWGWVGANCEICITECASNPCPSNKKCRAKYGGGYECICPADRTGVNCEIQNDACANEPCLNGGDCLALTNGDYQCTCVEPFAGKNCERQWNNPCTEEVLRNVDVIQFEYPWNRTQYIICTDINQWVAMPCSPKTHFESTLGHCVPDGYEAPACPPNFCLNDGECVTDEDGNLGCTCKSGFTGKNCEVNIDECELYGNPCGSGTCVDQINTYYCLCPNGGIGLDCSFTIPNPCTQENIESDHMFFTILSADGDHYLRCSDDGSFTVNRCAKGLFWNMEETTCTLDKPSELTGACTTVPCKNGGHCVDLGSSQFKCMCKEGYTGDLCEEMIDYCASNPCMNGGRCLPYAGGYTCVCPDKIIDDCCCTGVINPCPEKSKLIPGVNNYYPHLFPNKYIHCDFDGRAFVRNCAHGTKWRQEVLSCLSDDIALNISSQLPNGIDQTKFQQGGSLLTTGQDQFGSQFGGDKPQTSYGGSVPTISRSKKPHHAQKTQKELTQQQIYQQPQPQPQPQLPVPQPRPQPVAQPQPVASQSGYGSLPQISKTTQKDQQPSFQPSRTMVQRPSNVQKVKPIAKDFEPVVVQPQVPVQQPVASQSSYGSLPKLTPSGVSRVQTVRKDELKPVPVALPKPQEKKPVRVMETPSSYGSLPTIEQPKLKDDSLDQSDSDSGFDQTYGTGQTFDDDQTFFNGDDVDTHEDDGSSSDDSQAYDQQQQQQQQQPQPTFGGAYSQQQSQPSLQGSGRSVAGVQPTIQTQGMQTQGMQRVQMQMPTQQRVQPVMQPVVQPTTGQRRTNQQQRVGVGRSN